MLKGQDISINIDGVEVIGNITHRSEPDIVVKISSPYDNYSTSLHIPYFSRPIHSFLTEYGDNTAENLLKYLYELGLYMEENREFIRLQFCLHFNGGDITGWESQERFFGSTFPFIVPIGTRDQVLKYLRVIFKEED
jgi:hypothetical protein